MTEMDGFTKNTRLYFKISVSFMGKDRETVEKICERIMMLSCGKLTKDEIFFDEWHKEMIPSFNADDVLADIYGSRSEYVVVFISTGYMDGRWTGNIEWPAIKQFLSDGRDDRINLVGIGLFDKKEVEELEQYKPIVNETEGLSIEEITETIWKKYNIVAAASQLLQSNVVERQEIVGKHMLLPWVKRGPTFETVFPDVFIKPKFLCNGKPGDDAATYLIDECIDKNMIVTGEAGVGKSALLKYIFIYCNNKLSFYYIHALDMEEKAYYQNGYVKSVLALLRGHVIPEEHVVIMIDGIDECYQDRLGKLENLLKNIGELDRVNVWLGWREEHYHRCSTKAIRELVPESILLSPWDNKMSDEYVNRYAAKQKNGRLLENYKKISEDSEAYRGFIDTPFRLTLLLYILESDENTRAEKILSGKENALFSLYRTFFEVWYLNEKERGTCALKYNETLDVLRQTARRLYNNDFCVVPFKDSSIRDILVFSKTYPEAEQARGFCHKSFCAFFCADFILEALGKEHSDIARALCSPQKNDVTDFLRSGLSGLEYKAQRKILKSMMETYQKISGNDAEVIMHTESWDSYSIRCLKNELIYLMTRMEVEYKDIVPFLRRVYRREKDIHLRMDVAYGALLTGPEEIPLRFARLLRPGSDADECHRAWSMVYFGDAQGDPYSYRDDRKLGWDKSRQARLDRFKSKRRKAMRFRMLDYPIMYCFYESRDWKDISLEDYRTIADSDIDKKSYSFREYLFIKRQKDRLVKRYKKELEKHASMV